MSEPNPNHWGVKLKKTGKNEERLAAEQSAKSELDSRQGELQDIAASNVEKQAVFKERQEAIEGDAADHLANNNGLTDQEYLEKINNDKKEELRKEQELIHEFKIKNQQDKPEKPPRPQKSEKPEKPSRLKSSLYMGNTINALGDVGSALGHAATGVLTSAIGGKKNGGKTRKNKKRGTKKVSKKSAKKSSKKVAKKNSKKSAKK